MKNLRREFLISYDVENTRVRTHIFKELEKYGLRPVQKSVFWGYLTAAELRSVRLYLAEKCGENDKAFISNSRLSVPEDCFLIGHSAHEFKDWQETDVI